MKRLFTAIWLIIMVTATMGYAAAADLVFSLPKVGEAAAYDLEMNGFISISQPDGAETTQSVTFRAALGVSWEAALSNGGRTAQVRLITPSLQVGGADRQPTWNTTSLMLTFNNRGQLIKADTPAPLAELGIDFTLVLLGLVVPNQSIQVSVGDRWDIKSTIGDTTKGAYNLDGTYNLRGIEEWDSKKLARVEATLQIVPQSKLLMRRPKASVVSFVIPSDGRVERSSVSLESYINLPTLNSASFDEPVSRVTLTTRITYLGPLDAATLQQQKAAAANAATTAPTATPTTTKPATPQVVVNQPVLVEETAVVNTTPSTTSLTATNALPALDLPYKDPAGRFEISFPTSWRGGNMALSIDTTRLGGIRPQQNVDISVVKATTESLEHTANLALSAIERTANAYVEITPLHTVAIAGTPALSAQYEYINPNDERLREVVFFMRQSGYDFVIQYTDSPQQKDIPAMATHIASSFVVGTTPAGSLTADTLAKAGFYEYTDSDGRYVIEMPYLWPLFDTAKGTNSNTATFAELGRTGFLSVYVESVADNISDTDALQTLLSNENNAGGRQYESAVLGSLPATCVTYEWQATANSPSWQRRACAASHQGFLFLIVADYAADAAASRAEAFNRVFASFRLGPAMPPITEQPVFTSTLSSISASSSAPATQSHNIQSGLLSATSALGGQIMPANNAKIDDPLDVRRVLLVGRLGEQKGSQVSWLPGITLRLMAGASTYATVTDNNGYFAFANVAPLSRGTYTLASAEGQLFSIKSGLTVTFQQFAINPPAGRAASIGSIVLEPTSSSIVNVVTVANSTDDATRYYLARYPTSGWANLLRTTLGN